MARMVFLIVFFMAPFMLQAFTPSKPALKKKLNSGSLIDESELAIIIIDHGSKVNEANKMLLDVLICI